MNACCEMNLNDEKSAQLHEKSLGLVRMVSEFNDFYSTPRDYGRGETISMAEINTLSRIADNPGITVTELAEQYKKTKSAVSQIVSRLENKNYINKEHDFRNAKRIFLHASREGRSLSRLHKVFLEEITTQTHAELLEQFEVEELKIFFRVMEAYTEILERYNEQNRESKHVTKKNRMMSLKAVR